MYLIITEDGQILSSATASESDKESADMGLIDLIDLDGPEPMQYLDGVWHTVNRAEDI